MFVFRWCPRFLVALLFLSIGCSEAVLLDLAWEHSSTTPSPTLRRHIIPPDATHPGIQSRLEPHHVYFHPSAPRLGRLLVFFPGTNATPALYERFDSLAAYLGYHTIGLSYENRTSVSSLCGSHSDLGCAEAVRQEILLGSDQSPLISVDRTHSALNRLSSLLTHLDQHFPDEGWNRYLASGQSLNWSRITVAGHSQGGGHAGLLAKYNAVDRVIFFNSPSDFNDVHGDVASWINEDNQTPPDRYYAFYHQLDGGPNREDVYTRFGMMDFGTPLNTDTALPPFNGSHVINTRYRHENTHSVIIVDHLVPTDVVGDPLFTAAWTHLLTHNLSPVTNEPFK